MFIQIQQNYENTQDKNSESIQRKEKKKYVCKVCNKVRKSEEKLERHMKIHNEDGDWYCEICPYQTNNSELLKKHIQNTQECEETYRVEFGEVFSLYHIETIKSNLNKCKLCDQNFNSRNLMARHRKDVHPTYKPCRNINSCKFQSECFFSHETIPVGIFRCFECGEDFQALNTMMIHRKHKHEVKTCQNYLNSNCDKGPNCWWSHTTQPQGFWQPTGNLAPPSQVMPQRWPQIPLNRNQILTQNQIPKETTHQMIAKMLFQMEENLNQMKIFLSLSQSST